MSHVLLFNGGIMWVPLYLSCAKGACVRHFRRLHANFWFNCVSCVSWHTGQWQSMLKQSPNHKLKTVDMVYFYQTDKIETCVVRITYCRFLVNKQREDDVIISQASVFVCVRLSATSSSLSHFPTPSSRFLRSPPTKRLAPICLSALSWNLN